MTDTLSRLAGRAPIDTPAVLVAAHPDDETIGAGASLSLFRRLLLVHVTDGAPRNGADARAAGFATTTDYAAARRRELEAALAAGGADPALAELHAPDQEAALAMGELATVLTELMRRHRAAVVIAHPYEGGHPDHDASALIAHLAAARAGAAEIVEMTSYHLASDGSLATGRFLPNGAPASVIALAPDEQARKRAMVDAFASQRRILAGFGTEQESFRAAPAYDFAAPPHPGALHYEAHDWGMNFPRWRALAAAVLD